MKKTLGVSCMFLWIILAALCFGAVFDGIGAVRAIESLFITRWELSPWEVLIMMQLSYIVMGMFLDDTAMLVIVAPLYVPLVKALGFDPIWYGVLYTITCQIAYMTPPFGYNLFLMRAMAPQGDNPSRHLPIHHPLRLVMTIGLAIVMAFPQIALWLPQLRARPHSCVCRKRGACDYQPFDKLKENKKSPSPGQPPARLSKGEAAPLASGKQRQSSEPGEKGRRQDRKKRTEMTEKKRTKKTQAAESNAAIS